MSEVLAQNIEPLPYDPARYIELVERYAYLPEDTTTDERRPLLNDVELQLQSDVAFLRPTLRARSTFEGILAADDWIAAQHMARWTERGFAHGSFGRPLPGHETLKVGREALEYLRQKINETAEANDWKVFFPKDHIISPTYGTPGGLSWRMEQPTYIFDGVHFALIGPTLFQMTDGSVLGDSHLMNGLGPSHLRKYAEVRTVLPTEGDKIDSHSLRKQPFKLEVGYPEGVPTKQELDFLEKVLAAYY